MLTWDQWLVTVGLSCPAPLVYWMRWRQRAVPRWFWALSYFSAFWLQALFFAWLLSMGWAPGIWALMYASMGLVTHHLLSASWPPLGSRQPRRSARSGRSQ